MMKLFLIYRKKISFFTCRRVFFFFYLCIWGEGKLSVTNKIIFSSHYLKKKEDVCENFREKDRFGLTLRSRDRNAVRIFSFFFSISTRHEHDFLKPTCYEKSCDTTEKCVIQCEMMKIFRCSLAREFSSLFSHAIFLSLSMWCWMKQQP